MDVTPIIQAYYDSYVEEEWQRIHNKPEFLITCRYLKRHICPGDTVLDIGGGPGRYSLWLAQMGCQVTLLDLSSENVRFAKEMAKEQNLKLSAFAGDARQAHKIVGGQFDHVLLMGPLYHLLEEDDRALAVRSALKLLKPGGTFAASFINGFAGMIYAMREEPALIIDPVDHNYRKSVLTKQTYAGPAFTYAAFIAQQEILPFMEQFPLEKLCFFGQEGILSPCEGNMMTQSQEIIDAWIDIAEKLAEREELLSFSEHLMYIGRKTDAKR